MNIEKCVDKRGIEVTIQIVMLVVFMGIISFVLKDSYTKNEVIKNMVEKSYKEATNTENLCTQVSKIAESNKQTTEIIKNIQDSYESLQAQISDIEKGVWELKFSKITVYSPKGDKIQVFEDLEEVR